MENSPLTAAELQALYGQPRELVAEAWAAGLEATTRAFIAASPFLLLSSINSEGFIDMSPRGGSPGFINVIDDHNIEFLDQLGNRKIHTFRNLSDNNKVGLCFMIPGVKEVLRAYGVAKVVNDLVTIERLGGVPERNRAAVKITLHKVFPHCSNALNLAGLWSPESWLNAKDEGLPSLLEMARSLAESRGDNG
jgi:PPOX class probable FMN-dependent enzyme